MRSPSLERRLVFRLVAIFVVGALVAAGGAVLHAVVTLDSLADRSLVAQARDVERALVVADDGSVSVQLPSRLAEAYAHGAGGYLFAVFDRDGRALASLPADAAERIAALLGRQPALGFFTLPDPGASRPVLGYVADAGHIVAGLRVVVGQGALHDDAFYDTVIEEFLEGAGWWIAPVVLAVIAVTVTTVRASLRRLDEVSRAAAAIGPDQPNARLPIEGVPVEVRPLVSAVNGALDRLAEAFERQRRFTADAAHGLRTPLAVLSARIEALGPGPEKEALAGAVARMSRLVDQLLHVARLEATPPPKEGCVDVHDVAVRAASELAPLALAKRCTLTLDERGGRWCVHGNAGALGLALRNLIENAIEHSPPGAPIAIELDARGIVTVADRGPGIPPSAREAVFRRFWRGAEGGRGAGLGLAIVAEVMAAHGGAVRIEERPGWGAVLALVFPTVELLAPAAPPATRRRAAAGG